MLRGLKKFMVQSRHFDITHTITAKNRKQAWGKFVTLHFGHLKPSKEDWRITIIH